MVSKTLESLKQKKTNIRCKELIRYLEQLGFVVRDGKRGGHKVFNHPEIEGFFGGSFNCDHGKNPQIKPVYVQNIIKVIECYESELVTLAGAKK